MHNGHELLTKQIVRIRQIDFLGTEDEWNI